MSGFEVDLSGLPPDLDVDEWSLDVLQNEVASGNFDIELLTIIGFVALRIEGRDIS